MSDQKKREERVWNEIGVGVTRCIQWNPSITATIGEWHFGPYREVAFREGSCFFCCLHALVTYPYIKLSL